jgi:hypothetical protein
MSRPGHPPQSSLPLARFTLGIGCLLLSACSSEQKPALAPQPTSEQQSLAQALGIEPWHADFPAEIAMSPRMPGRWYDRTKRQALAKLVANLQGNTTAAAWPHAKMFFENPAPPGAAELLADAAESNYANQGLAAYLENLAEAMSRVGDVALSPTLVRLLDHPNEAVAARAMTGLASCGTREAVLDAEKRLDRISLRARADWLRAVAQRVPEDVEAIYARYLTKPRFPVEVQTILEQAARLAPALGAKVVEPLLVPHAATPDVALVAAGLVHRAGDARGTNRLREYLASDNPTLKVQAIKAATSGDPKPLLDEILKLSVYEDPSVREAVAQALATLSGDNIDETLMALGADVAAPVRMAALRALASRGKRYHLDELIARVRTSSGTNLSTALQDISASGDPTALAVIYERYKTTPNEERRGYMQALAYSRVPEVFAYLSEIFLGEEAVLSGSGLTTMSNAALLMPNLNGVVPKLVELFDKVPAGDYRRRAHMIKALANAISILETTEARAPALALFRRLWSDRAQLPQIRLFALQYHRRYLDLDAVMEIKEGLKSETEPMRWALSDWLHEFY